MNLPTELAPLTATDIAALSPDALSPDAHLDLLERVKFMEHKVKELRGQIEAALSAYVEVHGPVEYGDIRYYNGPVKDTRCLSVPKALAALMDATGGDFDRTCECLSSNAIKYGAARAVLAPDVYAALFEVTERTELKEGKPVKVKKLQAVNTRFIK